MTIGISTHTFKEAVDIDRTAEKIGEIRILWGLIVLPKLIYHEKIIHSGICSICTEMQFRAIHGYQSVDGFK